MGNNILKELTFRHGAGWRVMARGSYGFTLIEMLLVVGIIAVLTAVSIPLVGTSLENAKISTDEANERAARGAAMTEYLLEGTFGKVVGGVNTTAYFDAAAGQWKSENKDISPYGKCETEEHTDLVLGGELSSADGSLLLFWIKSGVSDNSSRIPTHSGLTIEPPTHPLAEEGVLDTNWNYTLSDNNTVMLNYYIGNEENVIVYGSYPVDGKTYKTILASNKEGVTGAVPYMFNGANCATIKTITFSNTINTSNVTSMAYMFQICWALQTLDLSNFNTSNVTNMDLMFYQCYQLTSLDVSGFDTSNVISMKDMFNNCKSLTTLNLSNFDTSNVESMNYMFYNCESLTTLDLSNFNTSNVKNMNAMFAECKKLTTLKTTPGKWVKTTGCETRWMFDGCTSLPTDQKNFPPA